MAGKNPKAQIAVGVDGTGAKAGVDKVVDELNRIPNAAEQAGREASAGLDKVGAGAEKAADRTDQATRRLMASLQRQAAMLRSEVEGTGRAGYAESLIKQRGLDAAQFAPILSQIRELEGASKKAGAGIDNLGLSAKQTRLALQQLPAQFTDIAVSLQGGQAPLTVLLQQGGQIRDVFGGAGNALRAIGGFLTSLITPASLAAGALAAIGFGFFKGREEAEEFAKALILTGNAAGTTVGQLDRMAQSIASIGNSGTQGKAAEVLALLVNSGGVGAVNLERFAAAAIQLERVGGSSVEKTAEAFSNLAKAPLQASIKLNEANNYLTSGILTQIKALEDQGKSVDAARVAQEAYASALEQRAPAILETLGAVERGWIAIKDAAKGAADALLEIGRGGPQRELQALQEALGRAQRISEATGGGGLIDRLLGGGKVDAIKQQIDALQEVIRLEQRSAGQGTQRAQAAKAEADFLKIVEQNLDKNLRKEREIAAARKAGANSGQSQQDIDALVKSIEAKYTDKGAVGAANREEEQRIRLLNELVGLTGSYTEDMARLNAMYREGKLVGEAYNDAVQDLVAKQPFAVKAARDLADAQKELAKASEDAAKAQQRYLDELRKPGDSVEKDVQELRDEAAALQLVVQKNISLADAIDELAIARLEEQQARAINDPEAALIFQREIELRRERSRLRNIANEQKAAKESAKLAADEWQKASERISQDITDALMRGFEDGKDIAENFADTLENLFKTLVLRPTIQGIVQPIAGSATGLGGNIAGQLGGGLGGLLNAGSSALGLSSLGSLGGAFNAGLGLTGSGLAGTGYALQGAGSLIGGGSVLSGLAQGAGALGPYALAAAAIYSIAKSIDKSGTPHMGSVVNTSAIEDTLKQMTARNDPSGITNNFNSQTDEALRALSAASVSSLNVIDRVFGGSGGLSATAKFAADGNDNSIGNFRVRDAMQRELVAVGQAGGYAGYDSDPAKGYEQFTADVAKQTIGALEKMALPEWARKQVKDVSEALGDGATAEEALKALGAVTEQIAAMQKGLVSLQEVMEPLGASFIDVAGLSSDAMFELADFAGGLENLARQTQGYAQNYLNRDEIAGLKSQEVLGALTGVGLSADTVGGLESREEFRALVESIDVSSEAGRKQFAALLTVQQDFAQIADYLLTTGGSLATAASLAPNQGPFNGPGADATPQVAATNAVKDSVDQVAALMTRLVTLTQQVVEKDYTVTVVANSGEVFGGFGP